MQHCPIPSDLKILERVVGPESCFSKCGGRSDDCWCDYQCLASGDCCEDYLDMCGVKFSTVQATGIGSCYQKCGGAGIDCWCDNKCMYTGDCCVDYLKRVRISILSATY